jgi:hypothetical protein
MSIALLHPGVIPLSKQGRHLCWTALLPKETLVLLSKILVVLLSETKIFSIFSQETSKACEMVGKGVQRLQEVHPTPASVGLVPATVRSKILNACNHVTSKIRPVVEAMKTEQT